MKRLAFTVLALMVASTLAVGANAQEVLHPSKIDASMNGLQFGGTRDQVLEALKKRVQVRYEMMIRVTKDVRDRDRLSRDMQKEIDDIQASRIVFDGTQTGWNVSILSDEFANGLGLEMILVREGNARYYLFFAGGGLYKVIETPEDPNLEPTMRAMKAAYGEPLKIDYIDTKKTRLDKAVWANGPLTLTLLDRTSQFQTVTIRWAVKDKDEQVQAEVVKRAASGPAMNPLIREAQEAPEMEGKDPVDDLIGQAPPLKKVVDKPKKKKKSK